VAAVLLGAGTAEAFHTGRAGIRPLSTVTTGGIGNPVLSTLEDLGALGLTVVAFVVPVLALLVALALALGLVLLWLRRRRAR
jgi:hypothetical protein